MALTLVPVRLRQARAFVAEHHRHHRAPQGGLFAVGAAVHGSLVGVAIAGRPVSRMMDDGTQVEVTRCCTDGTPNACSFLYAAIARAARALAYKPPFTYTLASEAGTSLVAAGWHIEAVVGGGEWSRPGRLRVPVDAPEDKVRWRAP